MSFQRVFRFSVFFAALCFSGTVYGQREWSLVSASAGVLQFPTSDTGYTNSDYGDSLIRTTDGGQSWSTVNLPLGYSASGATLLTFFGSNGWLVAYESDTMGVWLARLLRTTDYGFTWSILPFDSTLKLNSILFKSPSLGYLWTNEFISNFFYITTDSGNSWQKRNLPPSGIYGSAVDAVGSPNVIYGESDGDSKTFYVSIDTGNTWTKYSGPEMTYIGANTWITQNAWSTDNGQTWNPAQTTAQPNTPPDLYGATITDTLGHGMFIAYFTDFNNGLLYFTSNYGHSWDSANVPFPKIGTGTIIDNAWYVVPDRIDSDNIGPEPLYRSPAPLSSIAQTTQPTPFQILTNPAAHVLQLSLEEIPDEIHIVDFLGRTVGHYSTQGGAYSVDVSALPAGLYWVVTSDGALPFVHLSE